MRGEERTREETEGTHLLLEPTLDEVVPGQPNVLGRRKALERALVLVTLLELLAVDDVLDRPLDALDDDGRAVLHLLLLLLRKRPVRLGELLEILARLVALEHVLERGETEVVIDVVESCDDAKRKSASRSTKRRRRPEEEGRTVLSDVSNDQVGVLPDFSTLVRLGLSDEKLDEGTLSGSVGSEDGDTGREGDLKRDVVQLGRRGSGVLEPNVTHLHERLLLGLDSVEERGVGELEEVVVGGSELVVRLGLGDVLDERLEVSRVSLDLEAVKVKDVGRDVVEEARVVCGRTRTRSARVRQSKRGKNARETMMDVQVVSDLR